MISKHMKGGSFSRCLHYVIGKAGARVIGGNLLSVEPEAANAELQAISQRSQRTQKPLLHCALSLAPGEHLSEGQWRQLARRYLAEMGLGRNQYLLVRHTDTPSHEHVHLIVNRVGLDGRAASNSWDYARAQAVTHQLEAQYGLIHAPLSRQKQGRRNGQAVSERHRCRGSGLESLPSSVQAQVRWQRQLRQHVNGALMASENLPSFTQRLAEQGIVLKRLYRKQTAAGVSFEWQGQRIAGSRLGQAYSLPKLLVALDGMAQSSRPVGKHQEGEAEVAQLEPDEAVAAAQQRYWRLDALIQQQAQRQLTRQQIDLKIAQWILHSDRPEAVRMLLYSPKVQQLRQQQSHAVALDYLQGLMTRAQRQTGPALDKQKTQTAFER